MARASATVARLTFTLALLVIWVNSTTIPGRRVGRTIACSTVAALRRLQASSSRKVRAPQRRVAGNARPPRGEDQCHRDVAPNPGLPGPGSETRQTLLGARPNRRTRFDGPGNREIERKRSRCPVLGSAA